MLYCSECGVEITSEQKFCRECGVSLEENPPKPEEATEEPNSGISGGSGSSFFGKLQSAADDMQERAERIEENANKPTENPYKPPSNALMMASGLNGQVILFENKIRISRKDIKLRYKMNLLGKGEKEIRLENITSVQLKEPGMTNGYIQFGQSGYSESSEGAFDAASDENSVMFKPGDLGRFEELKDRIEQLKDQGATPESDRSEDEAMATLREMYAKGEINQEEYEKRKSVLEG